jgi:hypothetical protein
MKLVIKSETGQVRATLIECFSRPEVLDMGDAKPTVRNMALAAFATHPAISRVAYVCTDKGIPIFLIECAGGWFDAAQKPLEIMPA